MLLDDPLSALNGSVADHVYSSVIGRHGIMKGSCLPSQALCHRITFACVRVYQC